MTTTEAQTYTIEAPGAVITYDVRRNEASTAPALLAVGSPMGAAGFVTLAGHFADRTVVTYDPRSAERSKRTDGASETTPDEHAEDLRRVISALEVGVVDIFATSGGAVNALALVTRHPDLVRTLVAHEPPLAQTLPDRDAALAAAVGIHETYLRSGQGPGLAKFIALVGHKGPIPEGYADQPGPDPAMFGLSTEDDGSRDDALLGQNMITCTHYQLDFEAVKSASTRVVIAVGADSEGEMAHRAGEAVAARLGTLPVTFPGDHGGFMGGEYGQVGKPDEFAAKLRDVLAGTQ